ncbi:hypothetical protein INS49_009553 [Diaporthe citri]|uniref:uncharacterized protein n=1 Tax=Diaporthe citri TaxID=83186 RepID=UPI001C814ADC|nr:uncharacterized protein INS49_009553 [Diaporthe citri]KAG6361328.1 hypothetical protein INS49_009553 [Diaporthe citri]
MAAVDATFSVVKDLWSFFNWELWSNGLPLVVMAIIVWAIPIIAIFTPGTLTVQLSTRANSTIVQRPISSLNYSAVRQFGQIGMGADYRFMGPSSGISRLMATVAAQGSMLNPPAPYANCSYHLEFYGPSLSCGSATSTNTTRIAEIINPQGQEDPRPFVSFVPFSGGNNNETDAALHGLQYTLQGGSTAAQSSTYDAVSNDHGRIYIVINDKLGGNFGWAANKTIECGLYNTSYGVDFAFSNGQPNLNIVNATRLNGVASDAALAMCNSETSRNEASVCSPEAVAYIALLNAFGQQLLGYLEQSHYGHIWSLQTQVAKTVFMDTNELYEAQYYMNNGKHADTQPVDAMGMAEALEEVFSNATLSLFSKTSFLENETAAAIVPVAVLTPQNAFVYRPRNLLISYISGVTATAICVLVGFVCISKASSEAFGTSFSTIIRTTRNPELDKLVPPAETSGAEPLSKGLAAIKLRLVRGKKPLSQGESDMEGDVDAENTSGGDWSCFAIPQDPHDLESAPSLKWRGKAKTPASEVDVDSLLMPDE